MNSDYNHIHDGQSVDYELILESPENEITTIETQMNLVAGWKFNSVTIR